MKYSFLLTFLILFSFCKGQTVPNETGSDVPQKEAQDALDFHNQARKEVGTAPLEWSTELAAYSQVWAEHLATENGCKLKHRKPNEYGENIFGGGGTTYTAKDASNSWYSEIGVYPHEILNKDNWYDAGHYTQMIWKSSKKVGIGQADCPGGGQIIVANYDPPGNYMGEIAYEGPKFAPSRTGTPTTTASTTQNPSITPNKPTPKQLSLEEYRKALARKYPDGTTEETYTEGNQKIHRIIVVSNGMGDDYQKVDTRFGTFYFMNNNSIPSALFWEIISD